MAPSAIDAAANDIYEAMEDERYSPVKHRNTIYSIRDHWPELYSGLRDLIAAKGGNIELYQ